MPGRQPNRKQILQGDISEFHEFHECRWHPINLGEVYPMIYRMILLVLCCFWMVERGLNPSLKTQTTEELLRSLKRFQNVSTDVSIPISSPEFSQRSTAVQVDPDLAVEVVLKLAGFTYRSMARDFFHALFHFMVDIFWYFGISKYNII